MYKRTFFSCFYNCKLFFVLFIVVLTSFSTDTFCQIKYESSVKNGIYFSTRNFEGYDDTSYFQLVFLNDSTFVMSSPWASGNNSNLLNRLQTPSIYNNCFANNICIGRKILYKGKVQWFGIIDKDYIYNWGMKNYLQEFADTSNRFDIKNAINFDWNAKNIDTLLTKNEYGIYKFEFTNNSFNISQIRFIEKDDGILGEHSKVGKLPAYTPFFKGEGLDIQNIEVNSFKITAYISQKCSSLFLPIEDKIEDISAFDFIDNDMVYVGSTYMKYAFIISLNKDTDKIVKYGWILRSYLKNIRKGKPKMSSK